MNTTIGAAVGMSRPRKGYPDDAVVAGAMVGSSDGTYVLISFPY